MTNTILMVLMFVIAISLLGWLLISPLVFIWWFLDTETRDRITQEHGTIANAVYIGSFFSLLIVLGQGFEQLLVFIPPDWGGYDEDGEFITTRSQIAYTLAFSISFFFIHVFEKFGKLHTENERLSIIAEIKKRTDGLQYQSRETLIERRNHTKAEMQKLRERSRDDRLSSESENELWILDGLLDELDYRIRVTKPSNEFDEE